MPDKPLLTTSSDPIADNQNSMTAGPPGPALLQAYQHMGRREQQMQIEGIDHIQLAMPAGHEDAAREFYSRLLGIPEVPKPSELAKRGGVWFENGVVKVHLGVDPDFHPARKAHPGLLVRHLSILVRNLRQAGFDVSEDDPLIGYYRVYVNDPFGNRLELMERTA
jgi:catechol 2,3-dioxygenase-like lactoylglutathione lyase family enzyme